MSSPARLLAVCIGRAAPLAARDGSDRAVPVMSAIAKQAISRLADPVPVLSLIHISEPTRPY